MGLTGLLRRGECVEDANRPWKIGETDFFWLVLNIGSESNRDFGTSATIQITPDLVIGFGLADTLMFGC